MTGRLHIGLLGLWLDDVGVSFTVCRSLLFAMKDDGQMLARQPGGQRCAEVHASRTALRSFQLESLILAQNERWRQA